MPKRCVAGRCSRITQDNVSVHEWPKDSTVRDKWDRFVRLTDDEGVTVLTANQLTGDDGQGCSGAQSTDRATDSLSSSVKRASITSPTTSYKKPRKSRAMDKINIARVSC